MEKLLTIGMATYDDYDGVFFTIQSLRMYHDICNTDLVEFVVLDTNPNGKHAQTVENFIKHGCKNGKYIKHEGTPSSFNKYNIVEYAVGKYVLILDCHVLLIKNAIRHLIKYYEKNPNCKNLIQGPLIYDDLKNYSTHFDKVWRTQMYGVWATDKEKHDLYEPFEIQMQGMGLCSFERENWPGISNHFKGFGAEEGYIAEKFRRNGGKNICLPQLKWCHRFGRPQGVPYPLIVEDRVWNYFIGWLDATGDPEHEVILGAYDHFKNQIPEGSIDNILNLAKQTILKGEK